MTTLASTVQQKGRAPAVFEINGKRYLAILNARGAPMTVFGEIVERKIALPLKNGERIYYIAEGQMARGKSGFVVYKPVGKGESDGIVAALARAMPIADFFDKILQDTMPTADETPEELWKRVRGLKKN